jgi:hypothetical protein
MIVPFPRFDKLSFLFSGVTKNLFHRLNLDNDDGEDPANSGK